MNRQEVFDKVAKHLINQKVPSIQPDGNSTYCAYRGNNGCKCAIGVLIPDDLYSIDMEKKTLLSLVNKFPTVKTVLGIESQDDYEFLAGLQRVHDSFVLTEIDNQTIKSQVYNASFALLIKKKLKEFAARNNLRFTFT